MRCHDCIVSGILTNNNTAIEDTSFTLESIKQLYNEDIFRSVSRRVTLAGGEPLMNKEIIEIVKFLSGKNIIVTLSTNGLLLDYKLLLSLLDAGLTTVNV